MVTKKKPSKKLGRFFACPANGDSHPELIACEARETVDAKGKTRHNFLCPLCNTRVFVNNWDPEHSFRTIVWAEAQGLHCMGIIPRRKAELLKELGLRQAQHAPPGLPGPPSGFRAPPYRPPPKK